MELFDESIVPAAARDVKAEARAFAQEHGRVVYLEVDSDTILDRVADVEAVLAPTS